MCERCERLVKLLSRPVRTIPSCRESTLLDVTKVYAPLTAGEIEDIVEAVQHKVKIRRRGDARAKGLGGQGPMDDNAL